MSVNIEAGGGTTCTSAHRPRAPAFPFPWDLPLTALFPKNGSYRRADLCGSGKNEEGSDLPLHNKHQTWPVALEKVADVCPVCPACPLRQEWWWKNISDGTELCKECDGGRTSLPWLMPYGFCFHVFLHVVMAYQYHLSNLSLEMESNG